MIDWQKCKKNAMPEYSMVLIRIEDKSYDNNSRFALAYYDSPDHYVGPADSRGWVMCDGSDEIVRGKVTHWAQVNLPEGVK